MGCDIHIRVEYHTCIRGEKAWFDGDHYTRNLYFKKGEEDEWGTEFEVAPIYWHRDYDLFATLADVRNYGNTEVICEPRGLPLDVSEFVKADFERWDDSVHTPSWFTLKELIDFQNTEPVLKSSGLMTPEASADLDNGIHPTEWCQGTNNRTYIRREWEEKSEVLIPIIESLKDRCKELFWLYEDIQVLGYADRIRIVFWFDN